MRLWAFSCIILTPTITSALLLEKLKHVSTTSFGIESQRLRVCGVQYFELWQRFTPPSTGTDSVSESPPINKTQSRGVNVWAFAQQKLMEQARQLLNNFYAPPPSFLDLRNKYSLEAAENRITRRISICPSAKPNANPNGLPVIICGIGR